VFKLLYFSRLIPLTTCMNYRLSTTEDVHKRGKSRCVIFIKFNGIIQLCTTQRLVDQRTSEVNPEEGINFLNNIRKTVFNLDAYERTYTCGLPIYFGIRIRTTVQNT
jgi:hypothetical protein